MRRASRFYTLTFTVGIALHSSFAHAQEAPPAATSAGQKAACASAFEKAQVLRQVSKLRESRSELLKCIEPVCSVPVRAQCNRWLEEIDHSIPTIVLSVTADGKDRNDVQVEMDGEVLLNPSGDTPIAVNPGAHVLVFTYSDYPEVLKKIVVLEGDRQRKISISLKKRQERPAPPAPARAPDTVTNRPVPALAYVLGSAALAGAGAFAYLGATAESRRSRDEGVGGCAPRCSESEVSDLHTRLVAADVFLGVGVGALIGASISYLTRPRVAVVPVLSGAVIPKQQPIGASALFMF